MRPARPWPTLVAASALTLCCAAVAGVAGGGARTELVRGPSAAERDAAAAREVAERWRVWPAGRVFPAVLPYTAEQGGRERAGRIGISPRTACGGAVDPQVLAALRREGCRGVLRATYVDALRGVLVTIGVVVLRDELGAVRAKEAFPVGGGPAPGLRPLAFRGTPADRFTPEVRQAGSVSQAGPYLVVMTAGQVDGRPASAAGEPRPAFFAFASEMAEQVLARLSRSGCAFRELRC
ncbi:hypothetical protein SAMN05421874_1414 [Nonomuraea maritima]|uniref:PknH-like extracellular domain-containing protein n=1 Tax=Nonomuraea maritima TaxID=683260 RepID=A0A1G9QV98_9ACTN|nr:hypothetical protein [Nonomuraea maritima]SDM14914.1 hypothetical protein SAMN05421874_1414 [Nonomuraea maritima]